MMKISIILPVYNTAQYLEKCINSILNQSFPHFELLIYNDGSTDNSEEIILNYTNKDTRIKYKKLENLGVYKIRNIGLSEASFDYICFIDSDDWVEKDFLMDFMQIINENFNRLIVQDYKRIKINGDIIHNNQNYKNEIIKIPKDSMRLISNYKFTQGYLWNKIFIKRIIETAKLNFHEDMIANADEVFYLKYIQLVDDIIFVNKDNYNYIEREGSITRKNSSFITGKKTPI